VSARQLCPMYSGGACAVDSLSHMVCAHAYAYDSHETAHQLVRCDFTHETRDYELHNGFLFVFTHGQTSKDKTGRLFMQTPCFLLVIHENKIPDTFISHLICFACDGCCYSIGI
jgi:hypothetical protein